MITRCDINAKRYHDAGPPNRTADWMPMLHARRALMPWAESRTVWHGWGDQMAGALASAGDEVGNGRWVNAAVAETGSFTPHLLAQGGPDNGWLPAPIDTTQIAYGADATLQNLLATHDATGRAGFLELAGVAAAWYFGNNPAGAQMYDPTTGRTFVRTLTSARHADLATGALTGREFHGRCGVAGR